MHREEMNQLINRIADLIIEAKKIVVFTGAGVSTESGIPDFRSPGGIWSKYDPEDFTIQKFLRDPETRKLHWVMLTESGLMVDAKPNPAHHAIVELDKLGKLDCVITQNVDDLHQKAGVPRDKVFELHGNMKWVKCLSCGQRYSMEEVQERLKQGVELPDCLHCHGILKPEGIFFGEALPQRELMEATQRSRNCDLFIVIGSTLVVYPAAYMPSYAKDAGAKLVIINLSSTPLDHEATVLIRSKAGEAMAQIVERVKSRM